LLAVIKVARFMVVQQALEVLELFTNDKFESDSAYESDSSNPRRRQRKGCLQLVKEMMDRFIVRGTHSLSQGGNDTQPSMSFLFQIC
jgi:hypothetical protein